MNPAADGARALALLCDGGFVPAPELPAWKQACEDDAHLLNGLNIHAGHLTYYAVGKALGIDVMSPALALRA